ncbi:unnamed protein product [Soboliphyme baturini]|uniref:Uncharacterized protein n=1 Tax=Soboliphyme baturini TaxID=241478 RepID=A0A183IBR9_9BILA|nr:unnamed protein product [Soboliphyme baturini]
MNSMVCMTLVGRRRRAFLAALPRTSRVNGNPSGDRLMTNAAQSCLLGEKPVFRMRKNLIACPVHRRSVHRPTSRPAKPRLHRIYSGIICRSIIEPSPTRWQLVHSQSRSLSVAFYERDGNEEEEASATAKEMKTKEQKARRGSER